ncbi:unnamed protein product [Prorocentrum cordatum]|uniref:RNA helicase n=1 Tax=Prorocentrum cordatum TaxID=2364126 RepID=A0ABN9QBG8_9DINO|nr:unnamed protein product [Polarella glacialis]
MVSAAAAWALGTPAARSAPQRARTGWRAGAPNLELARSAPQRAGALGPPTGTDRVAGTPSSAARGRRRGGARWPPARTLGTSQATPGSPRRGCPRRPSQLHRRTPARRAAGRLGGLARPRGSRAAAGLSGTYVDDWGREQARPPTAAARGDGSGVERRGRSPHVIPYVVKSFSETGYEPEAGTFDGLNIHIFGMHGTCRDGQITWPKNGKRWTRRDPGRAGDGWQASSSGAGAQPAVARDWDPEEDRRRLEEEHKSTSTSCRRSVRTSDNLCVWHCLFFSRLNEKKMRAFTSCQEENREKGELPGPSMQDEEAQLFSREAMGFGAGIDFDLYDQVPADITGPASENIPQLASFDQLYQIAGDLIPQALMDNIRRCQFTRPTPVQKFAMPAGGPCTPDTLILSPTRELCLQIFGQALKFCHGTSFRCTRVYGKEHGKVQVQDLARGADLLVATPGRLWDWVDCGVISVKEVNSLVLDEADRMLEMQMESNIREVVEKYGMPSKEHRQTMMFSATFPERCQKLAADYMYEYIWVGVGVIGGASNTVTQHVERVAPEDKFERLTDYLYHFLENRRNHERLIVFTNSKEQAKGLDEQLFNSNFDTGALHGDLEQKEREDNLAKFRSGDIDVLIATDLASRGLDIHGVSHVVNFDLPHGDSAKDKYVQRIGRTGRIGHHGNIMAAGGSESNVPDWLAQKATELEAEHKAWSVRKGLFSALPLGWGEAELERHGLGEWSGTNGSGPRNEGANFAFESLERSYQAGQTLQPPPFAAPSGSASSWGRGDPAWSGTAGAAASSSR